MHQSSPATAVYNAAVKGSGANGDSGMEERYTCEFILPSILSFFASSLTVKSTDGSVAAKINQSPFSGSGCIAEVSKGADVLAVLFLYCALCT